MKYTKRTVKFPTTFFATEAQRPRGRGSSFFCEPSLTPFWHVPPNAKGISCHKFAWMGPSANRGHADSWIAGTKRASLLCASGPLGEVLLPSKLRAQAISPYGKNSFTFFSFAGKYLSIT